MKPQIVKNGCLEKRMHNSKFTKSEVSLSIDGIMITENAVL